MLQFQILVLTLLVGWTSCFLAFSNKPRASVKTSRQSSLSMYDPNPYVQGEIYDVLTNKLLEKSEVLRSIQHTPQLADFLPNIDIMQNTDIIQNSLNVAVDSGVFSSFPVAIGALPGPIGLVVSGVIGFVGIVGFFTKKSNDEAEAEVKRKIDEGAAIAAGLKRKMLEAEAATLAKSKKKEEDEVKQKAAELRAKLQLDNERRAKKEAELKAKYEEEDKKAAVRKAREEEARKVAELKKKWEEEEAKQAAELKKKQEEEVKQAAELKKKQEEEEAKQAAELKKEQEEEAKQAAEIKAKQEEEEAKQAAELKKKQEEEAKQAAELKKKQEEEAKLLEIKAKQEEEEAKQVAELKKKQDEEAKLLEIKAKQEEEAKQVAAKRNTKEKKSKVSVVTAESISSPLQGEFDPFLNVLDEMQSASGATPEDMDSETGVGKNLEAILTALSKVPLPKLRSILKRYPVGSVSLAPKDSLEAHLKTALRALWESVGGGESKWGDFEDLVDKEVTIVSEENGRWMKVAYIQAQELNETKLRNMIKKFGTTPSAVPNKQKMKGDEGESQREATKAAYVKTVLELLSLKHQNDYRDVAMVIEQEVKNMGGAGSGKGFGSK